MSSKKPVILYGASGYTGRFVAEYLREYKIPFIAAGRDAARIKSVMQQVPGIDTVDYEVVQVEHSVGALTKLFSGAKVVCNTVGPFIKFGSEVVQACLEAGCHYFDTTGEQDWVKLTDEQFGERFAAKGLVLAPATAYMYTTSAIAAEIALETPGLDTLDILVLWGGLPTYGSTQSIFANMMGDHYYLEQHEYVKWPAATSYDVAVPGQHCTSLALPWGGSPHPVWYKHDPRVSNVKVLGGVFDRNIMQFAAQTLKVVEEKIKPLPPDEQRKALADMAAGVQAGMPPRENHRVHRTVDSVYATGPNRTVHVVLHGACTYKQTGLLQAAAAHYVIRGKPRRVGFASPCQAFGHRELLGVLQSFGFLSEPVITGYTTPSGRSHG